MLALCFLSVGSSCERVDITPKPAAESVYVDKSEVAMILGNARLENCHIREVFDAVSASAGNGYDEEYTLRNIFDKPGSGVGEEYLNEAAKAQTKASDYSTPLRDIFIEHFSQQTKSGGSITAEEYLDYLRSSDFQIYWPYSENWDGNSLPVITFAPDNNAATNTGWYMDPDGQLHEVEVSEELAQKRPVWIINNNEDGLFTTLDIYKKNNPEWAEGGSIVIGPKTRTSTSELKTLILKDFTAKRNYDYWWQGASEFWVKIGSVENFRASTEAELKLYDPNITDFVVVVRRKEVGIPLALNTVLVSEWTDQLENCALMIVEDDGGTVNNWNCTAMVKYNSKSYGFEINIPYKSKDDIVWRGQLSRRYIESNQNVNGYFGDVMATFSIM